MSKEITSPLTEEQLDQMRQMYPVEPSFTRVQLPRLAMASQDVTEGEGKKMKVITEAGTFLKQTQTEEEDEDGKKIWVSEELGSEIKGIIFYQRRQLRMYDEKEEKYTSSPIFDTDEDIIPLFRDGKEVAKGTAAQLKQEYQFTADDGKVRSKLEENRILYVLYENEVYQMSLRGTSMFSFMNYARKIIPPTVLTRFSSEPMVKGKIKWNQMTFESIHPVSKREADLVLECIAKIKSGIESEKNYYNSR